MTGRLVSDGVLHDPALESDFASDGFALVDFLTAESVGRLLASFERHGDRHQGGFVSTLLLDHHALRMEVHREIAAVLASAASRYLRDYRAVYCGFAVKRLHANQGAMPLHQDITCAPPQGRPGVSLWAPLVNVNETNGCLHVVPGSHRFNRGPRAPASPFPVAAGIDRLRARHARPLPMCAGQALVMDQCLFHGSDANREAAARPVATAVMIPCEAPLVYYHRDASEQGATLEGFEVEDEFLLRHRIGSRPEGIASFGIVPEIVETVSAETLDALRAVPSTCADAAPS